MAASFNQNNGFNSSTPLTMSFVLPRPNLPEFTPTFEYGNDLTWPGGPKAAYPFRSFPSINPNPVSYTVPSPAYVAGAGVNADLLLSSYASTGAMPTNY